MAGINSVRNKLIDKYIKQGMSEEEAIMKADNDSQVRTEQQTPRTRAILQQAGSNAKDIQKMMDRNVKTTDQENFTDEMKKKIGSKKRYPSNLELLMYGKDWYNKKGRYLPKETK